MNLTDTKDKKGQAKSYIKYLSALILFGLNGIVASRISNPSYEIVFMRTGIGTLLLAALFFCSGRKMTVQNNIKDLIYIAVSGVAMGMSWIFLYEAYTQAGVAVSSLLYYCGPVIVMILSPLLFREKLTAVKIMGFAVVLTGVVCVNGGAASGKIKLYGFICGIASAVMYSLMVIFNKKAKNTDGLENSVLQLAVSFVTSAVFMGTKNGFVIHIQSSELVWILVLGLLNTGAGCYLYFSSIGGLSVQTVAVCGYLEPLSAVVFSALLLNEKMTAVQIAGAVMIIGGAVPGENVFAKYKKHR